MVKEPYGSKGYIDFSKLWEVLKNNGHNKKWLRENGVHLNTVAKLAKNENVSCEVLAKLCYLLDCQPDAIMEYVKNTQ